MVSPVVVTQKNRPLSQAIKLFENKSISAVPVLSMEGEVEGIVTRSDISSENDLQIPIAFVMSGKTFVISPQSNIKDAAAMMVKHHVHHLVVMDEGQVIGIVSSMDFVKYMARD